jgi:hypothetical protein
MLKHRAYVYKISDEQLEALKKASQPIRERSTENGLIDLFSDFKWGLTEDQLQDPYVLGPMQDSIVSSLAVLCVCIVSYCPPPQPMMISSVGDENQCCGGDDDGGPGPRNSRTHGFGSPRPTWVSMWAAALNTQPALVQSLFFKWVDLLKIKISVSDRIYLGMVISSTWSPRASWCLMHAGLDVHQRIFTKVRNEVHTHNVLADLMNLPRNSILGEEFLIPVGSVARVQDRIKTSEGMMFLLAPPESKTSLTLTPKKKKKRCLVRRRRRRTQFKLAPIEINKAVQSALGKGCILPDNAILVGTVPFLIARSLLLKINDSDDQDDRHTRVRSHVVFFNSTVGTNGITNAIEFLRSFEKQNRAVNIVYSKDHYGNILVDTCRHCLKITATTSRSASAYVMSASNGAHRGFFVWRDKDSSYQLDGTAAAYLSLFSGKVFYRHTGTPVPRREIEQDLEHSDVFLVSNTMVGVQRTALNTNTTTYSSIELMPCVCYEVLPLPDTCSDVTMLDPKTLKHAVCVRIDPEEVRLTSDGEIKEKSTVVAASRELDFIRALTRSQAVLLPGTVRLPVSIWVAPGPDGKWCLSPQTKPADECAFWKDIEDTNFQNLIICSLDMLKTYADDYDDHHKASRNVTVLGLDSSLFSELIPGETIMLGKIRPIDTSFIIMPGLLGTSPLQIKFPQLSSHMFTLCPEKKKKKKRHERTFDDMMDDDDNDKDKDMFTEYSLQLGAGMDPRIREFVAFIKRFDDMCQSAVPAAGTYDPLLQTEFKKLSFGPVRAYGTSMMREARRYSSSNVRSFQLQILMMSVDVNPTTGRYQSTVVIQSFK